MVVKTKLDDGLFEDVEFRRCRQTQCGFFLNGGCRACSECGAASFNIRKSCKRCDACETVPDSLRWDDAMLNALKQAGAVKEPEQKVKELEVLR